jgi:HAMP domain-containing protein
MLRTGQFGKRRLNLLGALIMGFSFFILKIIANAVSFAWRQIKRISSKLLSLTNQSSAVQCGHKTAEELKAEDK